MSSIFCNSNFINPNNPYPYRSEAEYEAWIDSWGEPAAEKYLAEHPELAEQNQIPDPEDCPCGTYQR